MLTGSFSTGSGATSQSKSVIVRSVGTTLRESMYIASAPSRNRSSSGVGVGLLVGRRHAVAPRRSKNRCIACVDRRPSSASRVGFGLVVDDLRRRWTR